MTTVTELIQYLQKLSPETTVEVAVAVEDMYTAWTCHEDLDVENPSDYSSNVEFVDGDEPRLLLGRV